jgi:hypothetical protein
VGGSYEVGPLGIWISLYFARPLVGYLGYGDVVGYLGKDRDKAVKPRTVAAPSVAKVRSSGLVSVT